MDFAAFVAPCVFTFHLARGVRLVGSVLLQFGARGGGWGGPSGSGPGNNGKGSKDASGAD